MNTTVIHNTVMKKAKKTEFLPHNSVVLWPIDTKLGRRGGWVHDIGPAKFEANPTTFKFSTPAPHR